MPLSVATNIAELDFAKIKSNIITAYKNDPNLSDFDFAGSTLSVLLDILAYTTHYQGVYANMALSERFLDSAQLRNSLVSIAKEIGYFPSQTVSATAQVHLKVPVASVPGNPQTFWILQKIFFTGTTTDNKNHEFVSVGAQELYKNTAGTHYEGDVNIIQGTPVSERFIQVDPSRPEFLLPTGTAVDSISCRVKDQAQSNDSSAVSWTYSKNAIFNTPTDKVFFLEEAQSNKIRLFFGDGIIGQGLVDKNEIIVDYLTSSGATANFAAGFGSNSSIGGIAASEFTITTILKASGGSNVETIQSIKLNAPSSYAAQNRAVTTDDYRTLLSNKFPFIESINVWGGEDNIPPQYGQVYIAVKPNYGNVLDGLGHSKIIEYLKTVAIVGTGINIVQPSLLSVNATTTATFSKSLTVDSIMVVETSINSAILNYFATTSETKLNLNVKYSKLLEAIDLSHPAISSNLTTLTLSYNIIPDTLHAQNLSFNMANSLVVGSVLSNVWSDTNNNQNQLVDDGNGILNLVVNGIVYPATTQQEHTVNYDTGMIKLNQFLPNIAPGSTITINATPKSNDVKSARDTILIAGTQKTTMIASA